MRLWTIQGIDIYKQLQRDEVAYCTEPVCADDKKFLKAYDWMAGQMRQRIDEPSIKDIKYPMWAWYQYISAKSNKPSRSYLDIEEGISVYMEIEIPDNEVLLSDFNNWHNVLNQWPLTNWKRIEKKTDLLEKKAGRSLTFDDYPVEIQKEIENSWEAIFDLDRRDKEVGRTHKRNRSIQATFWMLKPENVISVEFFERKGKVVKRIKPSMTDRMQLYWRNKYDGIYNFENLANAYWTLIHECDNTISDNGPKVWLISDRDITFNVRSHFDFIENVFVIQKDNFKKAKAGDYGYIYMSAPEKAILFSFEIIADNVPYTPAMDFEQKYPQWPVDNEIINTPYALIRKTGEISSKKLQLHKLLKHGLKSPEINAMVISDRNDKELLLYLFENFE